MTRLKGVNLHPLTRLPRIGAEVKALVAAAGANFNKQIRELKSQVAARKGFAQVVVSNTVFFMFTPKIGIMKIGIKMSFTKWQKKIGSWMIKSI